LYSIRHPVENQQPVNTSAVFFPFDLFGSAGTAGGADLLADALAEILADNRRERTPTRARAYGGKVRVRRLDFETLTAYRGWRKRGRRLVERILRNQDFLLWIAGNHLGVLPVYEELGAAGRNALVVQFDAHLDIHHFSDCTEELSHGNFLLHADGPLPALVNVGHRDLLMESAHVQKYYHRVFSADTLHIDARPALEYLRQASREAELVFLDIDCDVFDPAYFPGAAQPVPFGISPQQLLCLVEAAWSNRVAGVAFSEFDPGRDDNDRSLATLAWLLEYFLLRRYEPPNPQR